MGRGGFVLTHKCENCIHFRYANCKLYDEDGNVFKYNGRCYGFDPYTWIITNSQDVTDCKQWYLREDTNEILTDGNE